ncbi:hypothetical protein CDD80_294 [Ophiocordyceps camponoti-rufipedis]|uniref:monoamine oxidase n=1 Tax=Ophiocordyceps camponoti-rufipedis TaxID=2004952 RepID=A0A2C5YKA3_9HYPO|nr:hypothetical protein CDD80_294 [Ophiocordyceps camponoti-rufipedis]
MRQLAVAVLLALAEAEEKIIRRDVCILGGGSAGTFAAVRLLDRGKTVVIVEPKDVLGGHTATRQFHNGSYIELGVQGVFWDDLSVAYMDRLRVHCKILRPTGSQTDYVDFKTGQKAASRDGSSIPPVKLVPHIMLYSLALLRFRYLNKARYDELPDPVPEELLRPFGEFAAKHRLQKPLLDFIFAFAGGVGNLLETPLLYVLQNFGAPHVNAVMRGYITPVTGMYEVYSRAEEVIGRDNILFKSKAREVVHQDDGTIAVSITGGTTVYAKQLLVAFPLTPENTEPLDLDESERALFRKWRWQGFYSAIINTTGMPDGIDVINEDPDQEHNLPLPPFLGQLQYMGVPGYHVGRLVADSDFEPRHAYAHILNDVLRMRNTYPDLTPEIVVIADHRPTSLTVSVDDIRDGFYRRLFGMQGRRGVFYTGSSLCSDYSSVIWNYTAEVVDMMLGERHITYGY